MERFARHFGCGLAALTLLGAGLAHAQPPAAPPARSPGLALALEAAQTAISTCAAQGLKTVAVVSDANAIPVALLTSDGTSAVSSRFVMAKINAVTKYGAPSAETALRARTDTALAAELTANPAIGRLFGGGYPIKAGDTLVGAIAVSGATAEQDAACAKAGLDKIAARVR